MHNPPSQKNIYRKAIGSSEQKGDVSEDVGVNASLLLRKLQVVCVSGGGVGANKLASIGGVWKFSGSTQSI